ncbi:MAG: glucuronate isomerase [Chlamydiae bacterium]|nr:MAG: glucuronate isomerase [Chlamydiota bacterium]
MKKTFINKSFLLQSRAAEELYFSYAAKMPIIDYHCHLNPQEIADDISFDNLTKLWLAGDHYKWRAMRANGIDEKFITGDADDKEKFNKWVETIPKTLRNPLYHWVHLELKKYFDVDDLLSPKTADAIWEKSKKMLANKKSHSCRNLMRQSNVEIVCTTDDPCDSLSAHKQIAKDESFNIRVLPTWRPDKGMTVENTNKFNEWVDKLETTSGISISDYSSYMNALENRHTFFDEMGCRLSDHGIETIYAEDFSLTEIENIFKKIRAGNDLENKEILKFKSAMLLEFARLDNKRNWTQQLHLGALRNNNSLMFQKLGPDTGYDSIGDWNVAKPLSRFFDKLNSNNELPRTILYNLNPCDNEVLATMLGNFQDGKTPGKMQFGSGWWFLDQKDGMEKQIEVLSQFGLLSRFVGMLTDSRSFVSYPRHDYFRRILCNILGNDIINGLIPNDIELVGNMVKDICYNNAKKYFNF